jgi:Cu+-exporting ATPase
MDNINFKLEGLSCPACIKLASLRFKKIPGVQDVSIDLESGQAKVSGDSINLEALKKSLEGTNYSITK